jgi:hypothetical protein
LRCTPFQPSRSRSVHANRTPRGSKRIAHRRNEQGAHARLVTGLLTRRHEAATTTDGRSPITAGTSGRALSRITTDLPLNSVWHEHVTSGEMDNNGSNGLSRSVVTVLPASQITGALTVSWLACAAPKHATSGPPRTPRGEIRCWTDERQTRTLCLFDVTLEYRRGPLDSIAMRSNW